MSVFRKNKIALIDADSMVYLIGWNFREKEDDDEFLRTRDLTPQVIGAVDGMVQEILSTTGATHYIGALGHATEACFRNTLAKHQTYKGNRKEEADVFRKWKPVIKGRLWEEWGFLSIPGLEADDIVSLAADFIPNGLESDYIVCSIDKDLRQIPGTFYDYKKLDFAEVSQRQARWLFWYQMIAGDSGDHVAGIPKKGDKAAHAALDHLLQYEDYDIRMEMAVRGMYFKHFGDHYGKVIFDETSAVLGLVNRNHPFFEAGYFETVVGAMRPVPE